MSDRELDLGTEAGRDAFIARLERLPSLAGMPLRNPLTDALLSLVPDVGLDLSDELLNALVEQRIAENKRIEEERLELARRPNPHNQPVALPQLVFRGASVRFRSTAGVVVVGYQPGTGTSYDLEIVPRAHGGYLLVWDGVGAYGRLSWGNARSGGPALWELRAGARQVPKVDREAIVALCGELFRRGVLR